MLNSPLGSSKSTIQYYFPQMFVTSLNSKKYLAEHLLLIHLSTSHIALENTGYFEIEQGLIIQFEHILPNKQPI